MPPQLIILTIMASYRWILRPHESPQIPVLACAIATAHKAITDIK
jgi:hypothetical protein